MRGSKRLRGFRSWPLAHASSSLHVSPRFPLRFTGCCHPYHTCCSTTSTMFAAVRSSVARRNAMRAFSTAKNPSVRAFFASWLDYSKYSACPAQTSHRCTQRLDTTYLTVAVAILLCCRKQSIGVRVVRYSVVNFSRESLAQPYLTLVVGTDQLYLVRMLNGPLAFDTRRLWKR